MVWEFYYEDKSWSFTIEAEDYKEAYEKAYDTHSPQVEDMYYYRKGNR